MSISGESLEKTYTDALNTDMDSAVIRFYWQQEKLRKNIAQVSPAYKSISRSAGREIRVYNLDKEIALANSKENSKAISARSASLLKASNQQKKTAETMKTALEKYKGKKGGYTGK